MRIATVVLDIPTQALDQGFSYEVPDSLVDISVGCAVRVPFGNRDAIGFVVELRSEDALSNSVSLKNMGDSDDELLNCDIVNSESVVGNEHSLINVCSTSLFPEFEESVPKKEATSKKRRLKAVKEVLSQPYFTELGARCAQFLSEEYLAPLSSCVRLFTPPGAIPKMVNIHGRWEVAHPQTQEVDERWVVRLDAANDFIPRKSAVKQLSIMQALEAGDLRVSDLMSQFGSVSSSLKSLESKGVIRVEERRRMRAADQVSEVFAARVRPRPQLTLSQEQAMEVISAAIAAKAGQTVLLDGVTGSGKTEVYLCAIEQVLEQGRSAIVLVPEISLTPQTVARFRGRFGDTVAVLHSRMSNGERFDQWDVIRKGQARVVVGARSALFAPLQDVGIVIIDEEHESSYKQDQAPRYVTRDVAHWLMQQGGGTLMLGSATPAFETLYRCETDDTWKHVRMNERANGNPLPSIQVVDMSREFGAGNRNMFSKKLQAELFDVVAKKQKAVLLLNQRGFAQFLLCRDCGFVPECPSCSTSLTYHEHERTLMCHHCGYRQPVPAICPDCGSPYLKRFGAGTQRVEAELRALLANRDCLVVRMDADTTKKKGDHQRLLETFASADAAVLLGTQMIAKGLDFDEVTLVGVINADTTLNLPDFRAGERTFDLIEQVAGRCGRAHLPGKVIVQTYRAGDDAIRHAASYNRDEFFAQEKEIREGLGYPPFKRLVNILVWGPDEAEVVRVGQELFADINPLTAQQAGDWVVFPPTACVLARLNRVFRYHLLVKAPLDADVAAVLGPYFRKRKSEKKVNVSVDIDPISLL